MTNKKIKIFYFKLIILVFLLALGISVFELHPVTNVKASSKLDDWFAWTMNGVTITNSDFITLENSVDPVIYNSGSDQQSASDKCCSSLIFRTPVPIKPEYLCMEITFKVSSETATEQDNYSFMPYYDYSNQWTHYNYNQEYTVLLMYNESTPVKFEDKQFQYIQINAPYPETDIQDAKVEYFKLKIFDHSVLINGEWENGSVIRKKQEIPLYCILTGLGDHNGNWNPNFTNFDNIDVPKFATIEEVNEGIVETHTITYEYINNDFIKGHYIETYQYNIQTKQTYFSKPLEEIIETINNTGVYYNHNGEYFKRSNLDVDLNLVEDFSHDIYITASYEKREILNYIIDFQDAQGRSISKGYYYYFSDNGEAVNSDDLERFYENAENLVAEYYEQNNSIDSYYAKRHFVGWDIPYTNQKITSDLVITGIWEFVDMQLTINIYDKDINIVQTLTVKIGTKFKDLNLEYREENFYQFEYWAQYFFQDGEPAGFQKINPDFEITSDINIAPIYKFIGVDVRIYTTKVIEEDKENKDFYNEFLSKCIFTRICNAGDLIQFPLLPYYNYFNPVFYTTYNLEINNSNFDVVLENKIADASSESFVIPDNESGNILTIYLVYKYSPNKIIATEPPTDYGRFDDYISSTNDENLPQDNAENLPQQFEIKYLYITIAVALVINIVTVTIILVLKGGKHAGKRKL